MARPVYSKQFAAFSAAGDTTIEYTLPDTSTYVFRDFSWALVTDASAGATLAFYLEDLLFWLVSLPSSTTDSDNHECRLVAPGPLTFSIAIVGAGSVGQVNVSGYELTP